MERKINSKVQTITLIGVMSAMVFALSAIRIPLPSPDMKAAIHLGNVMCILSGLLFGGLKGGLCSGIGSMFYDFTNPLYVKDAPFTFINKFMMGFVAGLLCNKLKLKNIYLRAGISAVLGQLTYIVLYLSKSFIQDIFFYQSAYETAIANVITKGIGSLVNASIAVVAAVVLYFILRNIIIRTPFRTMLQQP